MENTKKGGRPNKNRLILIQKRNELIKTLQDDRWSNVDISQIFNIHPSQVTRIK